MKRILLCCYLLCACNSVKVPDVKGQKLDFAKGLLKGQNLEVQVCEKETNDRDPGEIIEQAPLPNTSVKKGDTIQLVVAKSLPIETYTLTGSLTLIASGIRGDENFCYGTGGYEDLSGALTVTVKDGKSQIITTGLTNSGVRPKDDEYAKVTCIFEFKVEDIPKSDFYSIEIGRRGNLNYSFEDLENRNWNVEFSIK